MTLFSMTCYVLIFVDGWSLFSRVLQANQGYIHSIRKPLIGTVIIRASFGPFIRHLLTKRKLKVRSVISSYLILFSSLTPFSFPYVTICVGHTGVFINLWKLEDLLRIYSLISYENLSPASYRSWTDLILPRMNIRPSHQPQNKPLPQYW